MAHDPHKDDPMWREFYASHTHDPLAWMDRVDTGMVWVWCVLLHIAWYVGVVVLCIQLCSIVIGVVDV